MFQSRLHKLNAVRLVCAGTFILTVVVFAGCSTTHYKESADREAYALIDEKRPEVFGMVDKFSIEQDPFPELATLPVNTAAYEYLGEEEAQRHLESHLLTLERALEIAVFHSRDYQNRKESLYLEALNLSLDRHRFTPIFSGLISGDIAHSTIDEVRPNTLGLFLQEAPEIARGLERLTGTPGTLLQQYADVVSSAAAVTGANTTRVDIVDQRSASARTSIGIDTLLKSGGRLALNLTSNFFRFLAGDPSGAASSVLSATFTQPLLGGRGRAIGAETLTQGERSLLYELRSFTRFRKTFAVNIATQYYGILRSLDSARNNYANLQSFEFNLERERALADEGQSTLADVGRQEQGTLNGQSAWVSSVRQYNQRLDNFKILLGFSTDTDVVLDIAELVLLTERGIIHPNLSAEEAIELALVTRLDLYTEKDRVEDSWRRVNVAADALKPGLDLVLAGSLSSKPGNRFLSPDFERTNFSGGFDLDLPLDRKAERNNYLAALISHERSVRDAALFEDNVKLDVRDAWRSLDQAKSIYEIRQIALGLNERRVEEQNLRKEIGQGNVLNQVDAQNDLTSSRNDLTGQLIAHTIARLEFWRDIGILFIQENGQWEEIVDVESPSE